MRMCLVQYVHVCMPARACVVFQLRLFCSLVCYLFSILLVNFLTHFTEIRIIRNILLFFTCKTKNCVTTLYISDRSTSPLPIAGERQLLTRYKMIAVYFYTTHLYTITLLIYGSTSKSGVDCSLTFLKILLCTFVKVQFSTKS